MRCGSQLTRNREGTLKPLSWSVFEVLKTVRILRRFRGQRGRQLKSSSRFSTSFSSSKFKVSANLVDVRKSSSVSSNIQVHTYDVIMETTSKAVSPYPSTSSSGRSRFESTTINVASTPRSQPSSSSAQRNCTTSKLKIVHLNIRSLRSPSHLTELRDWAVANKTDVITISETRLNAPVINSEVSIDGYKLYRQDRLRKRGGGVCAYIRKDITVTVLKDISHLSKNYFYQFWLKLQYRKLRSIVICISFRPPDCPLSCFEELLKPSYIQALTMNKPITVLGDLNFNVLKESPESKPLSNFLSETNLKQIIITPTRITDTCESLVDVILVSSPDLVHARGDINTSISDHLPVYVELDLKLPKPPPPCYISTRSYKHHNPYLLTADLATKSDKFLSIFSEEEINYKLATFNDTFLSTLDAHAPIKSIRIRSRPCPYVTREIKDQMTFRDQLFRRYRQS